MKVTCKKIILTIRLTFAKLIATSLNSPDNVLHSLNEFIVNNFEKNAHVCI